MLHGDDFKPQPNLEPFVRRLEGMFFFDVGSGPVLLLIHGNGDEADTWRHVLPALARTHRVIAPDLPGFGRSAPHGAGDLESLADGVLKLIDALGPERVGPERVGLERVGLVGSSLGAWVAAVIAAKRFDRVSSLTVVGGALPGLNRLERNPALEPLLTPGVGEAYYNGLRDQGQDAAYATLEPYYANLHGLPETDRAFLRERVWARVWSDTQRTAFFAALRSLVEPDQPEVGNTLENTPVLLVWGDTDRIVPIGAAQAIQERLPQARLAVISQAGHLPHQEQPEAFTAILQDFLENNALRSSS
jgi:pimeloyl-ACP methyl ester carboxylesterase